KVATKRRAEAPAYLQRLTTDLQAAPVKPISLSEKEITFGSDPVQSTYVLDDPSLAPRHARLTQTEDGDYLLADAGSIAGTWVNFEPIAKESRLLQHGDVVHFGQLAFRFELKNPPASAEPKITKENPTA
ncbi:MAG: FHA domain-containing protein, partial [Chloroflexi bacterium]|nr:FHA domain-containing protein [Chloroflexota bacterium]